MRVEAGTAELVEIPSVLERLSRRTRSETGKLMLQGMLPAVSVKSARERQDLLRSFMRYRDIRGEMTWDGRLKPLAPLFDSARETALLTGAELLQFRILIGLSKRIREDIRGAREEVPGIERLAEGIRDLEKELDRLQVISDDGQLYDHASKELAGIRSSLRDLTSRARAKCSELTSRANLAPMLQDRVVHFRKGRFALLVRVEDSGRFEGIAMDRSSSGKGVYIEPKEVVPLNNRIEILRGEEREEERRILSSLTAMLLEKESHIVETELALARIDVLHASAQFLDERNWILPELDDRSRFHFQNLWNPLIGQGCVPVSIHCGERFRQLVITGPNTGGKTVVLKSVAIAVFLALSGLPVPAAEGTLVGWIDYLAADIGDEQGIEQSLSTFSSHVRRIITMMEKAGRDSLLMLDELGAGTDPQEGAALGIAILEALKDRRSLVLATTHHNPIKRYALGSSGVETAGMEFDPVTLAPTFRLIMGIPGKSNALFIAERLGMPKNVIESAREHLLGEARTTEQIMSELFDKQAELESAGVAMAEERKELASLRRELEEKIKRINDRQEKIIGAADRRAREIMEEAERSAREMLSRLEGAAESAARKEYGKAKKDSQPLKERISRREESLAKKRIEREGIPQVGDSVRLGGTEAMGVVESIAGGKAGGGAGSMRGEAPLESLVKGRGRAAPAAERKAPTLHGPAPRGGASSV
ncbi:MAG TPA: endonuclease MutS2, partial [Synergistaceae bacterium]|nr:endonuclease MutS2 [Synergistaceae bacterium]